MSPILSDLNPELPEAASAVSESCAPEDDQSLSADRLVIAWMAQIAMRALALIAGIFTGWQLMNALLSLVKESMS